MAKDPALIWDAATPRPRRSAPRAPDETSPPPPGDPVADAPIPGGRVPLKEAEHQFGVSASTIGSWARSGKVDAVKDDGKWMVTPASVAAHLSEHPRRMSGRTGPGSASATGPANDGTTMLVPRDAWDKLLDQLGNLHEAGQMLADARERAAKAETEVTFLRERLSEFREERDDLRARSNQDAGAERGKPGFWTRLRDAFRPGQPSG